MEYPLSNEDVIANLDRVREVLLRNSNRLDMGEWHGNWSWRDKTAEEEVECGTTHCLAGWLQVLCPEPMVRLKFPPYDAGKFLAPIAVKMFFAPGYVVKKWLYDRAYVRELAALEEGEAPSTMSN